MKLMVLRLLGALRRRLYWFLLKVRNRRLSSAEIFAGYWRSNHWRNEESRSGDGSTLAYTLPLRQQLPAVLARHGIRSMLDLPCGDFNWFRHVALPEGITYIGADIVPEMIEELAARHTSPRHRFLCLDALGDRLPRVDLWMCRDLIFHLPNGDVHRLIDNFLASSIRFLLITSHCEPGIANEETFMGGFRKIDLMRAPFSLPQPQDRLTDYVAGFPPRELLLYSREVLIRWRTQGRVT
jgi:SAM-dependent methyltransferase